MSVRGFARGVGYEDPVYFDEDAADAAGYAGLPAPPGFRGTPVYEPGRSDPTFSTPFEGNPVRPGAPEIAELPNVLNAGMRTTYARVPVANETLTAVEYLEELGVKHSARLGDMLHVVLRIDYRDAAGAEIAHRGFVRSMQCEFRGADLLGRPLTCTGTVTAVRAVDGGREADVALALEGFAGVTATGSATAIFRAAAGAAA